jgi:hypothetical protein
MRRYVAIIVCAAAAGVALTSLGSARSAAATSRATRVAAFTAAAGRITFSVPAVVDPIHTFGEPSISFNIPRDQLFASGPTGTGTQRSEWEASVDHGHTFRLINPGAVPTAFQSSPGPKPGGGDTDMNFDRSGKEYFVDLYGLACDRTATTSNGGRTARQSFNGCGGHLASDRPWLAVYDPSPGIPHHSAYKGKAPLIYEEFNNLNGPSSYPNSGAEWLKSRDGLTWTNATKGVTLATEAIYSPFGPDGYPAIDQQTGKIFQAAGFPNSSGNTYDLDLNIGTPDAQGNLVFLDHPKTAGGGPNPAGLIRIAKNLPGAPDTLFTVLSMDSKRNLFVVYAVNNPSKPKVDQIYVSAASASSGWQRWTAPVRVSNASTATGDAVNVFPWIKAGGPGRADAAWYGSNKKVDPSSHGGQAWNVFMSQLVFPVNSRGQITGKRPSTALVKVSPHPNHYQDICLEGSACLTSQGNRNLADFFSLTIDKSGAAEIIYDDTSNGLVQPGFTPGNNQLLDHDGAPLVTVARQASGLGLYGRPVNGPSHRLVTGMADRPGDARYPVIGGKRVPGMDILHSSMSLSTRTHTLTVTMKVANLKTPSRTAGRISGAQLLEYVTRWQMGNTLFYAGMSAGPSGRRSFYAGKTRSVDLCSVSACFPHVLIYAESGQGGKAEKGAVSCPAKPSAKHPCTATIHVRTPDIGRPKVSTVLQEVGSYAFAASHPQGSTTNAQAQADSVPLEIDGACCYDFSGRARPGSGHRHRRHHHHRASRRPKHPHGFTG